MNMCDFKHEEVVYTSSDCPMCELLEEGVELGGQLNGLAEKFDELEYEHDKLVEKVKKHSPELLI